MSARLGLTEAELAHPDTRVPQQLLADMLNEAVATSGMRDLGLIAAKYFDSTHFGIGEYIARSRRPCGSIAEIAHALGFASPQSFHRAFKRWTGTTAARHRSRLAS